MKKIKSLYMRNYDGDGLVRDEVVEGSEWVLAGEGEATEKYDELLDHLAAQPEVRALAEELREAGLMWVCEGCGGEVCFADGVCCCGVVKS